MAETATDGKQLHRGLSFLGTLFIVLSAITPGSSVFIIVPSVIASVGTGSFLSFVFSAIVGLFMAFVYAELSSAFPIAGGEYTMIGKTMGKFWGFITFFLVFATLALIVAVIALGVGTYLGVIFPNLEPRITGAVSVILATLIAVLGIKSNAAVTGVFLTIEIVALLVLCGLGFAYWTQSLPDLFTHPQMLDTTSNALTPAPLSAVLASMAVALFAYNGYGGAAYFGEETKDAKRNIGRIVLWALLITVAAELIPLTAVLLGTPDIKGLLAADQKIEYFLEARGGHTLTVLISLSVALAIFNATIAIILQAARLLYSSARDRTWPAGVNNVIGSINPRFHSPMNATIVVAVIAAAACFIDPNLLFIVTGTTLVVIYILLCVAVIIGRRNGTTSAGHYRMPGFPIPAILGGIALIYVAYENFLDPALGRPSLLASLIMMVVAAIYYAAFLAKRSDWVLHAPEEIQE